MRQSNDPPATLRQIEGLEQLRRHLETALEIARSHAERTGDADFRQTVLANIEAALEDLDEDLEALSDAVAQDGATSA